MLTIRRFVQGEDEEVWVKIWNEAFKEYEEFRPLTIDDLINWENSPYFDAGGMFIAELDETPVGCVDAYIDKEREEKKGFIHDLGVVPGFRRRGIGRALLKRAVESLKQRKMECAEAILEEGKVVSKTLFESMGFKVVRTYSWMTRDLLHIPCNVGEHVDVKIRKITTTEEDIKVYNRLRNEAFKEHFNFRPETIEETSFQVKQNPWMDVSERFFAYLGDEPVGFIGACIDNKYNEHHKKKRGWIVTIGVIEPHRRQGIGTALMLHSMRLLKSYGMEEVALWVDDLNPTNAIELYKKVGFKVVRKDLVYRRDLV